MKDLKNIIDEIFVDPVQAYELIKKYQLYELFEQTIEPIQDFSVKLRQKKGLDGFEAFSSMFYLRINIVISRIEDENEKRSVEYLVSQLTQYFLCDLIENSKNPVELLSKIDTSLREACKFNKYDYNKLNAVFPISSQLQSAKSIQRSIAPENVVYYSWKPDDKELLVDLSYDLQSDSIVADAAEFRKLFENHDGDISVRFNSQHLDYIIVLIDTLYNKGIIKPKGNKGHFLPLRYYGVDFERKKFIKNDPKAIKYTVKKNKAKWDRLSEKIENKIRSLGLVDFQVDLDKSQLKT